MKVPDMETSRSVIHSVNSVTLLFVFKNGLHFLLDVGMLALYYYRIVFGFVSGDIMTMYLYAKWTLIVFIGVPAIIKEVNYTQWLAKIHRG